jgi:Glycosyltransferase 61
VLPKLSILNSIEQYRELPLLVDGWVHPNFHDALEMLNQGRREIIKVDRWELLHADGIVHVSPTAYIPAEYRQYLLNGKIPKFGPNEFLFSKPAILRMRNQLLAATAAKEPKSGSAVQKRGHGERLFVRRERHGNERKALNSDEAEIVALRYDFEPIEPSGMTIAEQIRIFSGAKLVAGQIGAALTNLLFAKPRCKVIAMALYYPDANYWFWSNCLGLLGHDLYHVLGAQVDGPGHIFHRNYRIDMKAFREALEKMCVHPKDHG